MTVALKWVFFFSGGKISMSCGTLVAMTTIPFFCLFKWQFELALKPEQHPGLLKSNCCLTRAQHLIPLPFFSSPICRLLFEIYSQILLLNPLSQLWNLELALASSRALRVCLNSVLICRSPGGLWEGRSVQQHISGPESRRASHWLQQVGQVFPGKQLLSWVLRDE